MKRVFAVTRARASDKPMFLMKLTVGSNLFTRRGPCSDSLCA